MLAQFENAPVVKTQTFPNRIATLHGGIKRADPCLITMHKLTVDINDQITISLIGFLKHWLKPQITRITQILLL